MQRIEDLRDAVTDLTEEVARLRRSFGRRTWAVAALAALLTVSVAVAITFQASNERRLQESNRRWCPLIGLIVVRPGDPPPTTTRGRQMADRASDLASGFNCPPENGA